jgi:preprotein translocase subunit SecA
MDLINKQNQNIYEEDESSVGSNDHLDNHTHFDNEIQHSQIHYHQNRNEYPDDFSIGSFIDFPDNILQSDIQITNKHPENNTRHYYDNNLHSGIQMNNKNYHQLQPNNTRHYHTLNNFHQNMQILPVVFD